MSTIRPEQVSEAAAVLARTFVNAPQLAFIIPGELRREVKLRRYYAARIYDGLIQGLLAQDGFEEMMARDVLEGQHRNPDLDTGWFTTAYFHLPDGLAAELAEGGLTVEALLMARMLGQRFPEDPLVAPHRVFIAIGTLSAGARGGPG